MNRLVLLLALVAITFPVVQGGFFSALYELMMVAYVKKSPDILEDSNRLILLEAKEQKSTEEIEQILRSFANKKDVFVASFAIGPEMSVNDALSLFGGTSWSAKDCQPDAINDRKYWLENRKRWIPQVRNFAAERYAGLMSFCHKNHAHILQNAENEGLIEDDDDY